MRFGKIENLKIKYDTEQEYNLYYREKVYSGVGRGTFPIYSLGIGQVS